MYSTLTYSSIHSALSLLLVSSPSMNAVFSSLMRSRIRIGARLALLTLSSTMQTAGKDTSGATCPEKSNQDGDPGDTESFQSREEKIMDECARSCLSKGCHCSKWKNKDQSRVININLKVKNSNIKNCLKLQINVT